MVSRANYFNGSPDISWGSKHCFPIPAAGEVVNLYYKEKNMFIG